MKWLKKVLNLLFMAVLLTVCLSPAACRAEDHTEVQTAFADTSLSFRDTMHILLKQDKPIRVLEDMDAEAKEAFCYRLSLGELEQFIALYKYSLLTDIAQTIETVANADGTENEELRRERTEKDIGLFQKLLNMRNERIEKSEDVGNEDLDEEIETEDKENAELDAQIEIPPVENDALSEENEESNEENGTSDTAFDIFKDAAIEKTDIQEADANKISDFESYVEYLQSRTDFDIVRLVGMLDRMEHAAADEAEEAYAEVTAYLDKVYEEKGKDADKNKTEDNNIEGSTEENPAEESENVKETSDSKKSLARGITVFGARGNAVARVGNNYYTSFNQAFEAMPDGGTLYVLKDCDITNHIETTKSFSIYPEGRNVTVTCRIGSVGPAGVICTPDGVGNPTWTFGGKDGYTLTFDANQKGGSGVLSCHAGTINLKSGAGLENSYGNGVWNDSGTTNLYEGAWIANNSSHGIASLGTINIYGGKIYGNKSNGVQSQKAINMYGGEIYGNWGCGVHAGGGACTFTMSGGSIYNNEYGVASFSKESTIQISAGDIFNNWKDGISTEGKRMMFTGSAAVRNNGGAGIAVNGGSAAVQGGKICENSASGIINNSVLSISGGEIYSNASGGEGGGIQNRGNLTITGGAITGNWAAGSGGGISVTSGGVLNLSGGTIKGNTAQTGGGVFFNGSAMNMDGNGAVDIGNDVYLSSGKFVTVTGRLNTLNAAMLTPSEYKNGRKMVRNNCGNKMGSACFENFMVNSAGAFCLRPGDYQSGEAGTGKADVVLSTKYAVRYRQNYNGEAMGMPQDTYKYWYEEMQLSPTKPSANLIKFIGWAATPDAEKASYQPGDSLSAAMNHEMTLYAVWKTKIKIIYAGNKNGGTEEKYDYVTLKECLASQGYVIRKNAGFTKYSKENATFAGWDITPGASSKGVLFSENKTCKLSYEELFELALKQQGTSFSEDGILQKVTLYAIWDEAPKITAGRIQEFYEGVEVSKDELLKNVSAADKEDGDLTRNIRILRVEYADGKLVNGEQQKGYADVWEKDMPMDYRLDTWFMQMAKEDSPVTHKITCAVTDSIGNESRLEYTVRVKYNEFPDIKVEDWYYTLEEAKNGVITEEALVTEAQNEGRAEVSDKEDDVLFPGEIQNRLELVGFAEEDFTTFEDSGYMVITYSVKDSMGPGGEGKETMRQCTVHIIKDGEIVKPPSLEYVRFINEEYYQKNLNMVTDSDDLEEDPGNGGLRIHSKWYKNPEYRSRLSDTWAENKTADEVWKFSEKDVKKAKSFIREHGIGNSREKNALTEFAVTFGHLKE